MGLYKALPEELREVDVIIAGGGTAGCVVASRLAEADPELSILVIEGGPNNHNVPQIVYPALFRANLVPGSDTCIHYMSGEEKQLANRQIWAPAGGTLGGGSSVNGALYTRAQRSDFDSWNVSGWSSEDLGPYLNKHETYHGEGDERVHGYRGPLEVSRGMYRGRLGEDFVDAMKATGCPEVDDLQNLQTGNGVARSYAWISPQNGQRQEVAHKYLHPLLQDGSHPNLHVLVESQVVLVLFDSSQHASGVEYRANPRHQDGAAQAQNQVVKARRLVILSGGAHGTPAILERSGVGDPEILARANVPNISPLPGVGRDYQDHQLLLNYYKSGASAENTLDSVYDGTRDMAEMVTKNDEILSWNGFDASSKNRPTDLEVDHLGPDFRKAWDANFREDSTKPLISMLFYSGVLGDPAGLPPGQYFTLCTYAAYPYSRGHVHITGPGIDDPLDFSTGYLTDRDDLDLKTHIWAYKKQREVARRMHLYRGELVARHPKFPEGSAAGHETDHAGDLTSSEAPVTNEVQYSPEDDEAIERWVRETLGVCWHFLGTCKMAPREERGVVDERLAVYGVQGLKVADMSIVPKMVSANTFSTAVMIGEKAADIFIQDLGLAKKEGLGGI